MDFRNDLGWYDLESANDERQKSVGKPSQDKIIPLSLSKPLMWPKLNRENRAAWTLLEAASTPSSAILSTAEALPLVWSVKSILPSCNVKPQKGLPSDVVAKPRLEFLDPGCRKRTRERSGERFNLLECDGSYGRDWKDNKNIHTLVDRASPQARRRGKKMRRQPIADEKFNAGNTADEKVLPKGGATEIVAQQDEMTIGTRKRQRSLQASGSRDGCRKKAAQSDRCNGRDAGGAEHRDSFSSLLESLGEGNSFFNHQDYNLAARLFKYKHCPRHGNQTRHCRKLGHCSSLSSSVAADEYFRTPSPRRRVEVSPRDNSPSSGGSGQFAKHCRLDSCSPVNFDVLMRRKRPRQLRKDHSSRMSPEVDDEAAHKSPRISTPQTKRTKRYRNQHKKILQHQGAGGTLSLSPSSSPRGLLGGSGSHSEIETAMSPGCITSSVESPTDPSHFEVNVLIETLAASSKRMTADRLSASNNSQTTKESIRTEGTGATDSLKNRDRGEHAVRVLTCPHRSAWWSFPNCALTKDVGDEEDSENCPDVNIGRGCVIQKSTLIAGGISGYGEESRVGADGEEVCCPRMNCSSADSSILSTLQTQLGNLDLNLT